MTDGQNPGDIAALLAERNELRREIAGRESKWSRIRLAFGQVREDMELGKRLHKVTGEESGIIGRLDGAPLPEIGEILETHNRLLDARVELEEIERQLDSV